MKNKYKILTEIIELCLSVDKTACSVYNRFASECKISSLAAEWKLRAHEERSHIIFWRHALTLSEIEQLPLIFENPEKVKNKMNKINSTIKQVLSTFNAYDVPSEELIIAFFLENYMLDPILMMMFHDYSFINKQIDHDYEKHILAFKDMAKNYQGNSSALKIELLNDTLYNLYINNKKLLKDSIYDTLTGLYNRRGFFNNAIPILSLAERKKLNIGIIMIDFDNFKEINDTLGHSTGDKALQEATSIITSCIRGSSICGRYGGDEFIVLCDIESMESLENICERIRKNIDEKSKEISGVHFTVSLGAATGKIEGHHEASIATIIQKADENLFKAKKNGKNSWIV